MKHIIWVFFVTIIFFTIAQSAFAHAGGGPPFVKINNIFANTNPYSPALEDKAPENYLTSQPIDFLVDTQALNVPPDIIKNSIFRWDFADGSKTETTTHTTHSFSAQKTYLVKLDVQAPGNESFIPLDVIEVNVLLNQGYKPPFSSLIVQTGSLNVSDPLLFKSKTIVDSSSIITSYLWDFGDGTTSAEKEPVHKYKGKDFSYLVSLRITDSKGFSSYSGFVVSANNGKLDIVNPFDKANPVKIEKISENNSTISAPKTSLILIVLVGGIFIIGLTMLFAFLKKKK